MKHESHKHADRTTLLYELASMPDDNIISVIRFDSLIYISNDQRALTR